MSLTFVFPPNVRRLPNHLKASVVAKHLQHAYPCHFVVVYVKATARAGIEGYLLKDSPQDELVEAIR